MRGTVLLVALVVVGLGTLGITAWVAMLHARVGQVGAIEDAAIRRVRHENSRALASEYMFMNVVTGGVGSAQAVDLPNSWGSFGAPAWTGTPFLSNTVGSYNNQFSPAVDSSYESSFDLTLADGVATLPQSFKVRSYLPMLSGDIFTLHRPTLSPSSLVRVRGNIDVYGRAVLWGDLDPAYPGDFDDLEAMRFIRPSNGVTDFAITAPGSGGTVMPDNYPMVPSTYGVVGGAPAYDGRINVVSPGLSNPGNSLMAKAEANSPIYINGSNYRSWSGGVHCNGDGRVYIELDTASLRSVIITNVFRIYLYGQSDAVEQAAAGAMNPVIIVHTRTSPSDRGLYSIRCFDANNRKLTMGIKKEYETVETDMFFYDSFDSPTWRMILAAENVSLRLINLWGGAVNFKGGIQTDSDLRHTGWYSYAGVFNIIPEDEPDLLVPFMVRNGWMESSAQ